MILEVEQAIKSAKKRVDKTKKGLAQADDNLDYLEDVLNKIKAGRTIYKDTLTRIISSNADMFYELLNQAAINAAIASVEYDYPPYLARLKEAMKLAQISVKEIEGKIIVDINLDPLGDITEWGNAVKVYREKNTQRKFSRKKHHFETGENLAYRFWKEKIYGSAREGKSVSRRIYDRKKRSYSFDDVTSEYSGKYKDTIEGQLALVEGAPFWYLIEYGNANPKGFPVVAPAYPKVKPQSFREKARKKILDFIQTELQRLLPKVETEWINRISEELKLPVTPKLSEVLTKYGNNLAILLEKVEDIKQLKLQSVIGRITTVDAEYRIIVTGKSIGLQYQLGQKK